MKRLTAPLLIAICAGFGSGAWGQSIPTSGAANAIKFQPVSLRMQCTEMVAHYHVSAGTARKVVPSEYEVKLNDDGTATLMLPIQECSQIGLNFLDAVLQINTTRLAHAWIAVEGPANVIDPVEGAAWTWPTMYWYYVQGQTDNLLLAAVMMLSGVQMEVIDGVTLGGLGPGFREGQVVEREHPLVTYTWREYSASQVSFPPYSLAPPVPVGVNHVLYRKQAGPTGPTLVTGKVRCLIQLYGMGMSTLTADPSSVIGKIGFHTQLSAPMTLDFDQGCTADFQTQSLN